MGYGCFNATGLDRDSAFPKTLTFDYAYTSSEEFAELQASGEIDEDDDWERFSQDESRDEFENWASTICAAGKHLQDLGLKVTAWDRTEQSRVAWSPYGDRYQYLKTAFEVGKVGAYWQEEPFMGGALCLVIAPQYHFYEPHDVWSMDAADFRREYGTTITAYKASSERQATLLVTLMLSWMEAEMSAVSNQSASVGSGYIRKCFKPSEVKKLPVAIKQFVRSLSAEDQRRHRMHVTSQAVRHTDSPVLHALI